MRVRVVDGPHLWRLEKENGRHKLPMSSTVDRIAKAIFGPQAGIQRDMGDEGFVLSLPADAESRTSLFLSQILAL